MSRFKFETPFNCSAADLFQWHMQTGAFERLCPPWIKVKVLEQKGKIEDKGTVLLEIREGIIKFRWHLAHDQYIPNKQFCDYQLSGPFKSWRHFHRFIENGENSILIDEIEYELPVPPPLGKFAEALVNLRLTQLFKFRHEVTKNGCQTKV
ncbi:MAG: SRPBCC family protein [Candidatus Obscuribacterales bacterium]|nr:SRPBCC family protein [Candidatus Obscuribacterales bacterium]